MKKKSSLLVITVIVLMLAVMLAAFSPLPAVNFSTKVAVVRTPIVQNLNQQLAYTLQREHNWLQRESLHLGWANQAATTAQNLINKTQAGRVDTTELQNALNTFEAQIATAQGSYNQAASILGAPAGFDGNGQVTDTQTAHQTLVSARDSLQQTHLSLVNASLTFRTALQSWRMAHHLS